MSMSMRDRIKAGKLYTDMCEGLPEERLHGKELMYEFNHTRPSEVEKRERLIREMFGSVGEHTWIEPPIYFSYGSNIHIGKNFYANFNFTIVDDYTVTIGNNVWIGSNVVINPGITIGDNSVIGAGSIVTKDIPADVVAVGVPCRVLRTINERDREFYYQNYKVEPSI